VAEKQTGRAWWPKTLNQMVRCSTYMGLRCELVTSKTRTGKPTRGGYGKVLHQCEPLVPADVWKAANARLDAKPKRGPACPTGRC
jgi:hypothetical protein